MTLPPMTGYFENEVLRKLAYLKLEWCVPALENPIHRELQEDGRIRQWVYIETLGKYLRVVTLADGITLHNAFPDRRFHP